jgi:hypothetical protein
MKVLGSRRPLCKSSIMTRGNGCANSRYFITDVYGLIVWDFVIYTRQKAQ